jgi:tetratricopeptide (TPR) repeat protein
MDHSEGILKVAHGAYQEGVALLRRTLKRDPHHPDALLALGYGLWRIDDPYGSIDAFRRAIAAADMPLAHVGLGCVLWDVGDIRGTVHHCQRGLEKDPTNLLALCMLREVAHYGGDEDAALAACDRVIALRPDDPVQRHKRAMVMLAYDDPAGWEANECRYEALDWLREIAKWDARWRSLFSQRWTGEPVDHLVIGTEQGYGDFVQFLRYLPMAAERCKKVSLCVDASMHRLIEQSFSLPNVTIGPAAPDNFDAFCLIMSLPYLLDMTSSVPPAPYLRGTLDYPEIRALPGHKVGLVWEGSNRQDENRYRSIPFKTFLPILDVPNISFVSLQLPCKENLRSYKIVPTPYIADWSNTAALVEALDLVISVDTAVAHLAGALGKPVWLLNRFNGCWRWGFDRETTPWYPSMRIFRQPKLGSWDAVIHRIRDALCETVAAH